MPDPLFSLVIAVLFVAAGLVLFLPDSGIYHQWRKSKRLSERVLTEDALKHIHRCEMHGHHPTIQSIAGALNISANHTSTLLTKMAAHNLLRLDADTFRLSPEGRDYALRIIRAHRLWERYLADETGFNEAEWHDQAEVREHLLSEAEAEALFTHLGKPTHDPHGDPIPNAAGEYVPHGGVPLTSVGLDSLARIVHLEDEPEAVYAQLVAEGLHPGMELRVIETTPQRIRFWADGDEHLLAPMVAANISVVPYPDAPDSAWSQANRLSDLQTGAEAVVLNISPAIRGLERRRLMDLGILPGTPIRAEFRSPGGDPVAYQVRGATIALRRQQTDHIRITSSEEVSA